ncbi:hypothetical protein L7F22_043066 [Adiantum nelumboides]|nr:hypothetical protein [Adiantum nelumboides]
MTSRSGVMKVLVAGAGGRTGRIAYQKLRERPDLFEVRGLVRTLGSKDRLGGGDDILVADITRRETLTEAFDDIDALVILTGSIPKMKASLNPTVGHRRDFFFDEGGYPEQGKPKDYEEGGQAVKFDTFHGTHDKLKALLFLLQFDAAFAGGNFTESSKIRKAATFLKTKVDFIVEPGCGTFNMGPVQTMNCESLEEYNAKVWDALLPVSFFKIVPLAEQIDKYCYGLPKGIKTYCTKTSVMNMAELMEKAKVADDLIQGKPDEVGLKTRRKEPQEMIDRCCDYEQVDYMGQVNQIDLAKTKNVRHVVLVSSMGGKYPHHPLNALGDGNILIWKRKAEEYMRDSGLPYTIIRAGLLEDEEGGRRELLTGADDELLYSTYRRLPREDLATVVVQALLHKEAQFKAFDLVSKPEGEGMPPSDFRSFFSKVSTPF